MSTRVSRPNGRLLSNVVFLGLCASVVAGCSDSTSRFDNLFTSSVVQPQRIDGGGFGRQSLSPQNSLRGPIAQQLPANLSGNQNSGLFNARNIARQSQPNGFRPAQSASNFNNQPQFGAPTFNGPQQIARAPSISRQALPPAQNLPPQATFQAPQPTIAQPSQTLNPTGGRLTLDQARQLNDVEGRQPLLARQPQQQAFLNTPAQTATPQTVAPIQEFETGTAWTRHYSPVPTGSPIPKSSLAPSSGPKGYTRPQGVYTSNIDSVSTSSVSRSLGAPKIIRSSVAKKPAQHKAASTAIDPVTVTSINRSSSQNSAKGGWSATGGTYVALRPGETLYSVSRRYGVPVKAIASANNISDPRQVRSGQQILIPTYVYSPDAPISAGAVNKPQRQSASIQTFQTPVTIKANTPNVSQPLPAKVASDASLNGVYTVQKGDTLSAIAAKNSITLASLRNANGLHTSDVIRVGQKLNIGQVTTISPVAALPRLDKTTTASVAQQPAHIVAKRPRSKPLLNQRVNLPKASVPQVRTPRSKPVNRVAVATQKAPVNEPAKAYTPPNVDPITTSTTKTPAAKKKQVAATNFIWPVRGEVISRFGSGNDGINLNVPKGTPVRAASSGEVIYASNGLADYGNLVLIRHSNGFVSAYAHNSKLSVRRGERVRQGQVIAKSGDTGSVKSPQVHFELRKGKVPVDPLSHLSG